MIFLGPIFKSASDKEVSKLVRRGHATDSELFAAQFGEWPVRGLEIDTSKDGLIQFKSFSQDKKLNPFSYLFRTGYVKPDPENRDIYLNRWILSPVGPGAGIFASRMALARFHDALEVIGLEAGPVIESILVGAGLASSYRYAMISSLTKLFLPSVTDVVGQEHIHRLQIEDPNGIAVNNTFKNKTESWLLNQSGFKRDRIQTMQFLDAIVSLMPIGSFAQDTELQARLHNIMVRGYKSWGRLPQNIEETGAALMDYGIKTPRAFREYLQDDNQITLRETFSKHSAGLGYTTPPAAEMNIGLNSFRSPELIEDYWNYCLKLHMGGLLTYYGDSKGMDKMQLSQDKDILGLPLQNFEP